MAEQALIEQAGGSEQQRERGRASLTLWVLINYSATHYVLFIVRSQTGSLSQVPIPQHTTSENCPVPAVERVKCDVRGKVFEALVGDKEEFGLDKVLDWELAELLENESNVVSGVSAAEFWSIGVFGGH